MERSIYLAGPMSGIPQFNFPAFDEAARRLRAKGHRIVSPAELDDESVRSLAMASPDGRPTDDLPSWGQMLARDVRIVADHCSGIALLPGWSKSRGAKLEAYVAILCGHALFTYDGRLDFAILNRVSICDVTSYLV